MSIRTCSRTRSLSAFVLTAAIASCAVNASAAIATYTDLYTLATPDGFGSIRPQGYNFGNGGQLIGYASNGGSIIHAVYWSPTTASTGVDLTPDGYSDSLALGMNATQQVGSARRNGTSDHAILWTGTADSYVDLNYNHGYTTSHATGVGGAQQVGDASGSATSNHGHAALWTGSADSFVDLNASVFSYSNATATDGTRQVGSAQGDITNTNPHAMLWSGTADSYVDLNPAAGYSLSFAYGISGDQQVGNASADGADMHAALWTGTADSFVDLNPDGMQGSEAYATDGSHQVGYSYGPSTSNNSHAMYWNGTAASAIDLNARLSSNFVSSVAGSIVDGKVYGFALDTDGNYHAIVWSVPEPTSLCGLVAIGPNRSLAPTQSLIADL